MVIEFHGFTKWNGTILTHPPFATKTLPIITHPIVEAFMIIAWINATLNHDQNQ
jgi:hypothetical protein